MTKKEMVTYLLDYLIKENPQFRAIDVSSDLDSQETLLRALLTFVHQWRFQVAF